MTASDTVLAAMRETNAIFSSDAVQKRNPEALDRVYTAGARILPPAAEMIEGREAIKRFWSQAIAGLNLTDVKLSTIQAEQVGDAVVEIGRAELAMGGGQSAAVKYVVVWRQEDGRWKWGIDIWNSNA